MKSNNFIVKLSNAHVDLFNALNNELIDYDTYAIISDNILASMREFNNKFDYVLELEILTNKNEKGGKYE